MTILSMNEFDEFNAEFARTLIIAEDEAMTGSVITFPANISREDFERMKAEIRAAIGQAERRGEQRMWILLMGEGSGEPVGIVKRSELNEHSRESNDKARLD